MTAPKFTLRAHVGLDYKSNGERCTCIHLVGPDGYAYACQRLTQRTGPPSVSTIYISPSLDSLRPGWRKSLPRMVRRAYYRSTPATF